MMSSRNIFIISFVTLAMMIFLIWKGLSMRREIESQEVIPLDSGIAAVTGSNYLVDKLKIRLHDNGKSKKITYDEMGMCVFKGLSNQKSYTLEFRRTDLKGMLLYKKLKLKVTPREGGAKYFVLVGASVGKSWEFPKLADRLNLGPEIVLGYRCRYDFDKSNEINTLTKLTVPVSGVIIKECAAYFPRDIISSKKRIIRWVTKLRSNGVTPILATIVPVTKEHDENHPQKFDSILEFNDFIRDYAVGEGIATIDLEKALRISAEDRHLKDEYADPDGLHLVLKAYRENLDNLVLPLLAKDN